MDPIYTNEIKLHCLYWFQYKKVIHISPIDYIIDEANGITNPLAMYGNELEVDFLVTYIGINHFKNYIECINN